MHPPSTRREREYRGVRPLSIATRLVEAKIFQLFWSQGSEGIGRVGNLAFPGAGLALAALRFDGHESHDWVFASGNHDLLAAAGFLDEAGKLGFGLMNGDGFHLVS